MKRGWIWRYGRANRIWVIKARLVRVGSGGEGYGTRGDGAMRRERCRADRAGGQGGLIRQTMTEDQGWSWGTQTRTEHGRWGRGDLEQGGLDERKAETRLAREEEDQVRY